jgi:hypothetical protein
MVGGRTIDSRRFRLGLAAVESFLPNRGLKAKVKRAVYGLLYRLLPATIPFLVGPSEETRAPAVATCSGYVGNYVESLKVKTLFLSISPFMRFVWASRIKALHDFNSRTFRSVAWIRWENRIKSGQFLFISLPHRLVRPRMAATPEEVSLQHRPVCAGVAIKEDTPCVPLQHTSGSANVATKEGKTSKLSIQLKTPKGTRDCKASQRY